MAIEDDGGESGEPGNLYEAPTTPDPCAAATASSYSTMGHKAYSTVNWYYNGAGAPDTVAGSALTSLTAAAAAVADGRNDCGITTVPRTSFQSYVGTTTRAANFDGTTCRAGDNYSVMAWGSIAADALGVTCLVLDTTVTPRRLTSADVVFNIDGSWASELVTCKQRRVPLVDPYAVSMDPGGGFDFQGAATHEFGHMFGLGHVSESGVSSTQTMSPAQGECTENERTLGRGDLNGMLSIYGSL